MNPWLVNILYTVSLSVFTWFYFPLGKHIGHWMAVGVIVIGVSISGLFLAWYTNLTPVELVKCYTLAALLWMPLTTIFLAVYVEKGWGYTLPYLPFVSLFLIVMPLTISLGLIILFRSS